MAIPSSQCLHTLKPPLFSIFSWSSIVSAPPKSYPLCLGVFQHLNESVSFHGPAQCLHSLQPTPSPEPKLDLSCVPTLAAARLRQPATPGCSGRDHRKAPEAAPPPPRTPRFRIWTLLSAGNLEMSKFGTRQTLLSAENLLRAQGAGCDLDPQATPAHLTPRERPSRRA